MQIILTQDVEHLGKAGELVNVKPGYARNFLVPKGMAVSATETNKRHLEHNRQLIAKRVAKEHAEASGVANRLNGMILQFERRVSDDGRMFGSVTTRNIAEQLKVAGVDIDHRHIMLDEPIKAIGKYEVSIKLKADVDATLKFWVVSTDRE